MISKDGKNIVLDFDGTLIDTERIMLACCKEYAEMQNLVYNKNIINEFVGACPEDILKILWREFGKNFDAVGFVKNTVKFYNNKLLNELAPLLPNAVELLQYLKNNGWTIGMATTTYMKIVSHEIKGHNIDKYFDYIVTGDMVDESKPSPKIYYEITERMGVKPEDCYAVEDSTVGITSAITAGMRTIAVPDLHAVSPEFQPKCTAIVKGCKGVIEYLGSIE